jgi:hypothetical protein
MFHWRQLVGLLDAELDRLDIALVNLACAADLSGAELIDHERCVRTLDWWAECVRQYTEHYLPKFHADPAKYQNSEAYYRCLALVTVLQRDLGVRYNLGKMSEDAPFDTADSFIHGIIQGDGGTCATMPVVYAAVGRRLGYPIWLVQAKRHLFVRWDDPAGERLNIEGTNRGLSCPADDHYRSGAYEVGPATERAYMLLVSQTPRMELAGFLTQRGCRQYEGKDYQGAADSFAWACVLVPENKLSQRCLEDVLQKWGEKLTELRPSSFPEVAVTCPLQRQYPAAVPVLLERQMLLYEQLDRWLSGSGAAREWGAPAKIRQSRSCSLTRADQRRTASVERGG